MSKSCKSKLLIAFDGHLCVALDLVRKNKVLIELRQCWSFTLLIDFLLVQIADLANEDTPQIYAACGRGPRSTLRVLRHGLEVLKLTKL